MVIDILTTISQHTLRIQGVFYCNKDGDMAEIIVRTVKISTVIVAHLQYSTVYDNTKSLSCNFVLIVMIRICIERSVSSYSEMVC